MTIKIQGMGDLKKSLRKLNPSVNRAMQLGLKKVAVHAMGRLIQQTPKGFTGQTRRSWSLLNYSSGKFVGFEINNKTRTMRFLEEGTKAHGPKTANMLYIPLNRKASMGWKKTFKFGKDYVLAKKVSGIAPMKIVDKRRRIVERQGSAVINRILKAAISAFA